MNDQLLLIPVAFVAVAVCTDRLGVDGPGEPCLLISFAQRGFGRMASRFPVTLGNYPLTASARPVIRRNSIFLPFRR